MGFRCGVCITSSLIARRNGCVIFRLGLLILATTTMMTRRMRRRLGCMIWTRRMKRRRRRWKILRVRANAIAHLPILAPQNDIDGIRALVEYRRKHPEEFPEILDEETEGESATDHERNTSASPTPASSGEESDAVVGGLKVPKSPFQKKTRSSSLRAMSADLARSAET